MIRVRALVVCLVLGTGCFVPGGRAQWGTTTSRPRTTMAGTPYTSPATTPTRSPGGIYLRGGNSSSYGYIYTTVYGLTAVYCADSWDDNDAQVACRELGYSHGLALKNVYLPTSYVYTYYHLRYLRCRGSESTLKSCYYSRESRACGSSGLAVVSCMTSAPDQATKSLKVSFESVDNSTNTGKVVIKTKGLTLQPCAQFWSQAASKQLCINQGFKTGVTFGLPSADNSLNVTELPVWLWNNTCNSTTRGSNCLTSGKAVQTCTDTSSVAVFCSNNVGDFKMRLQGGPNKKEGRVEIMYKGRWWSICDSNWDMASAIVVCRQLGYGAARPLYDKYASKTRHFLVDHTRCNGSESNIFDCESDAWNTDGGASTVTCPDKYQGAAVQCEPPVQLSGGAVHAGNVEVFSGSSWSSVCGTGFGSPEALVTCRQLGYDNGVALCCDSFGTLPYYTTLPIYNCRGDEKRLENCDSSRVGCYRDGYASVHCFNGNTTINKIGLTGGYIHRNKAISGTVMITQNSQVGRICSHSLDNRAANVMCKQLGFAGGVSYVHQDTQYRAPVFLLSLSCSGSESSIDDCLINKTTFVSSCDHAGVLCYESSGVSVSLDGSVVQVSRDGETGYVCRNDWGDNDANVLCRQIGYNGGVSGSAAAVTDVHANPFASGFRCRGDEDSLFQCESDGWRSHKVALYYCDPKRAATAICFKDVKLVNAIAINNAIYGRVEYYYKDSWYRVCANKVDDKTAVLVCEELGYSYSKLIRNAASGKYSYDVEAGISVQCGAAISTLADCTVSTCSINSEMPTISLICSTKAFSTDITVSRSSSGALTFTSHGIPGRACGEGWDDAAARVACRQLNFTSGVVQTPYYTSSYNYNYNVTTPYWFTRANCTGNEKALSDCKLERGTSCPSTAPSVGAYCTKGTDVRYRITGGNKRSGYVEIYVHEKWLRVCTSRWSTNEASVFCRQMGYSRGMASSKYNYYSSRYVGISRLYCKGTEKTLLQCRSVVPTTSTSRCSYTAYVTCLGSVALTTSSSYARSYGPVLYLSPTSTTSSYRSYALVCNSGFDNRAADVVCRELGYAGGRHVGPSTFGVWRYYYTKYRVASAKCSGTESSFNKCQLQEITTSTKSCSDYASVVCYSAPPAEGLTIRTSSSGHLGIVMATYLGQNGYVCDKDWDNNDAKVACRQLRPGVTYRGSRALKSYTRATSYSYSSSSIYPIWLNGLQCVGNESRLQDCKHAGIGNGAGCTYSHYRAALLCLTEDLRIRLSYGTKLYGMVDIYINGVWGSVCPSYYYNNNAASTICKMLGFKDGTSRRHYYRRSATIWATNMHCQGTEKSLFDCSANWGQHSRYSCSYPLSVRCYTDTRLDGNLDYYGRLKVHHRNTWFSVTANGFTRKAAQLACKNMGLNYVDGLKIDTTTTFSTNELYALQVKCDDKATKFADCSITTTRDKGEKAVALFCSNTTIPQKLTFIKASMGSSSSRYGVVSVQFTQIKGSICPVNWDVNEARVICRAKNYNYGIPYRYRYYSSNNVYVMGDVKCKGTERSLSQCSYATIGGAMGCNVSTGVAGAFCSNSEVAYRWYDIDTTNRTGVLMMKYNNALGYICSPNQMAARIACKQRNYTDGTVHYRNSYYRRGTRKQYISSLQCDGWETNLYQCRSYFYIRTLYYYSCNYEIQCSTTVRLTSLTSSSRHSSWMGYVNIFQGGEWKRLCGSGWDSKNSDVVCRQLGYSTGYTMCCNSNPYSYTRYAIAHAYACTGNEKTLDKCPSRSNGLFNICRLDKQVAVFCASKSDTTYRLSMSIQSSHARLLLNYHGYYGRVCLDGWDTQDARVACRQLGYSGGDVYTHLEYSSRPYPFLLTNISCTGNEAALSSCKSGAIGNVPSCKSPHSAGIVCYRRSGITVELDGKTTTAGKVQVRMDSRIYNLCSGYFYNKEARVLCRESGFSDGHVTYPSYRSRVYNGLRMYFRCLGNESSVTLCPRRMGYSSYSCYSVYVQCYHKVRLYKLYSVAQLNSSSMGPLQVYQNGTWNFVSDRNFTDVGAAVVCQEMGFSFGFAMCCSAFGNISYVFRTSKMMSCTADDLANRRDCKPVTDTTDRHYVSIMCSQTIRKDYAFRWKSSESGLIEVNVKGHWGRICDNGWDDVDAHVFCISRGYNTGLAYSHLADYGYYYTTSYDTRITYARNVNPIFMSNVRCQGNESSLTECSFNDRLHIGNCSYHSAGAVCFNDKDVSKIAYRVSGGTAWHGRVEVNIGGTWGTVCVSNFADNEAYVLCKQLGFYGGSIDAKASIYNKFSNFTGQVWRSYLRCSGKEASLQKCPHRGYGWSSHARLGYYKCYNPAVVMCQRNKLRLWNSHLVASSGPVLVYNQGLWQAVCGDGWTDINSAVVCGSLGYQYSATLPSKAYHHANKLTSLYNVTLKGVRCSKGDVSLFTCKNADKWDSTCTKGNYVSVYCSNTTLQKGMKVLGLLTSTATVSLNKTSKYGIVYISVNGVKGMICRNTWTSAEANATCRELGFAGGEPYYSKATTLVTYHKPLPYLMSSVKCTQGNRKLSDCKYDTANVERNECEPAGVLCYSEGISFKLVYGASPNVGLLEITYDGESRGVCHSHYLLRYFGGSYSANQLGKVACKSVGYRDGILRRYNHEYKHWLSYVSCKGHENTVLECQSGGWSNSQSLYCSGSETFVECTDNPIRVGTFIGRVHSSADGELLAYAEVSVINKTIPISACHRYSITGQNIAPYVCRKLGFKNGGKLCYDNTPRSRLPFLMVNLQCSGNETVHDECNFLVTDYDSNCGVLCVKCSGETVATTTTTTTAATTTTTTTVKTRTSQQPETSTLSTQTMPTSSTTAATTTTTTTATTAATTTTATTAATVKIETPQSGTSSKPAVTGTTVTIEPIAATLAAQGGVPAAMNTIIISSAVPAAVIVVLSVAIVTAVIVRSRRTSTATASGGSGMVRSGTNYVDMDSMQNETPIDARYIDSDPSRTQIENPLYDVIPAESTRR